MDHGTVSEEAFFFPIFSTIGLDVQKLVLNVSISAEELSKL